MVWTKKVKENGRKNEDGFSMVIWNGYMIIRNSFEQQIIDKLSYNKIFVVVAKCIVNVAHKW